MNHRAGFINGEGDGVGIHIDIPRELWKEKARSWRISIVASLTKKNFVVGHFFLSNKANLAMS